MPAIPLFKPARFWPSLIIVYVLSRITLIGLGYGADNDAWRLARSGINWIKFNNYSPSRAPGYPLMEALAGIFAYPLIVNSVVALFGIGAVIAFWMLAGQLDIVRRNLAAAAFAFLPLFWVFSATTMDYVPALCMALWAFYFIGFGKPVFAGIIFGLAVGFRPASLILLPALIAYGWGDLRAKSLWAVPLVLCAITIFFTPLLLLFGFDLFIPSGEFLSFGKRLIFAGYRGLGAFGTLGWMAVLFGICFAFVEGGLKSRANRLFLWTFVPFLLAWFALPHESGYWLTVAPFVLFAVFSVDKKFLTTLAIILIIPAAADISPMRKTPDRYKLAPTFADGMVIGDFLTRTEIMFLRDSLPNIDVPKNSVVLTGRGASLFELNGLVEPAGEFYRGGPDVYISRKTGARFVDLLPENCVDSLIAEGIDVYIMDWAVPAVTLAYGWRPSDKGVEVLER